MLTVKELHARRTRRVRTGIRRKGKGRPRLSVFRSIKHIYAQVIDDGQGRTLAAASSIDKAFEGKLAKGTDRAAAAAVGKLIAERAAAAGLRVEAHVTSRHDFRVAVEAGVDQIAHLPLERIEEAVQRHAQQVRHARTAHQTDRCSDAVKTSTRS